MNQILFYDLKLIEFFIYLFDFSNFLVFVLFVSMMPQNKTKQPYSHCFNFYKITHYDASKRIVALIRPSLRDTQPID